MNIFDTVLYPIKWVISAILVAFHTGWTAVGFNPSDGLTWVLSILGLVLIVRAALIPLFVKQIKSQRKMMEVAPQLKKIQEKYKGKRDQFSREAMSRETMELYRRTGTSPLSSCLPLLVQMPIFFSLFSTLNNAQRGNADAGVGLLTTTLAHNFAQAKLFGAPLAGTIAKPTVLHVAGDPALVVIIAVAMIVLMTASQFVTQLQLMAKNMSDETKASPMYKQQRVLLYFLPLIFIFSGISFPIGVMFYWVFSNLWTMGQQFVVIRNSPTPGSDAARARDARLAARAAAREARQGVELDADAGIAVTGPVIVNGQVVEPDQAAVVRPPRPKTQRAQPVGKARAKRANEGRA